MKYYQRLKDVRNDAGKNQEEIAAFLETTQQQYSRWESGNYQMPLSEYKKLARYYDVSLDYLAGLIDEPVKLSDHKKRRS